MQRLANHRYTERYLQNTGFQVCCQYQCVTALVTEGGVLAKNLSITSKKRSGMFLFCFVFVCVCFVFWGIEILTFLTSPSQNQSILLFSTTAGKYTVNVRVLRTATTHLFILLQTIVSGIIIIVQRSIFCSIRKVRRWKVYSCFSYLNVLSPGVNLRAVCGCNTWIYSVGK